MITRLHILDRFSVLGRESREVRQYMPQNPFEGPRMNPQEAAYAMQRLQMEAQRRAMMMPQGYPQMLQRSPLFPMQIAHMAQMYGPQYQQWGPVNAVNAQYDIGARLPYMPFQYLQMLRPASPVYYQQFQRPMLAAYPMQNFGYNQPQFALQYYQRYQHPVYRPPYQVWRPQQMYPQAPAFRPSYTPQVPSRPAQVPVQQYGRQTPMFVSPFVPRPATPSYTQSPSVQNPPMFPPLTNAEMQMKQKVDAANRPIDSRQMEVTLNTVQAFVPRLRERLLPHCTVDDQLQSAGDGVWTLQVRAPSNNRQTEIRFSVRNFEGAGRMLIPSGISNPAMYTLFVSVGGLGYSLGNDLNPVTLADRVRSRLFTGNEMQQQTKEQYQKMNEEQEKKQAEAQMKDRVARVQALNFETVRPLAIRVPLLLPDATLAALSAETGQLNPYILVDYSYGNEPRISIPRSNGQPWTHTRLVLPTGLSAAPYYLNQPAPTVQGNLQSLQQEVAKVIASINFS